MDYEVYGSGDGGLRELVYEPAERLKEIFSEQKKRFVVFVEAAEFEMIEAAGTDHSIDLVKRQIRDFYSEGYEIGLHLHPQWYNARCENGRWQLDYDEYNMCILPQERIARIVDRAISYLRVVLGMPDFSPLAFRAGNWLFQPAQPAAAILANHGVKIDSSVFKGGVRHEYGLDYRQALRNGYYWKFSDDAVTPCANGIMTEIPIYTQMVPFWRMFNAKRVDMERKGSSGQTRRQRMNRILDLLRFRHPLKLDFCRMTIREWTRMLDSVIREDGRDPSVLRPIVAIGHTKELSDLETVKSFLDYLEQKGISVTTFQDIYTKYAQKSDGNGYATCSSG